MMQRRGALAALVLLCIELPLATAWVAVEPSRAGAPGTVAGSARSEGKAFLEAEAQWSESAADSAAASVLPVWTRALLAAAAALVVAVGIAGGPRVALAEEDSVQLYFGQGCFWHVQHEFVKKEISALGRQPQDTTSLVGYAGSTKVGDGDRVCYHNLARAPDYGQLGHTEVVGLSVPKSKVGEFAKFYLDAAAGYPLGRADPQDRGTEYRSAIGLPGGVDSPLFAEIQAANNGRMELVPGQGGDADTLMTDKVWVYDSNKFPFYQGEVYHQYHDDMLERYPQNYHKLKQTMLDSGRLKTVQCPELGF